MPGLAEMHAHLMGGDDALNERILLLNVARGITTVRGMLGHPSHLVLRERVRKGELLGPTIYTSGPSLNGKTVPDAAAAEKQVAEQKAAGYDFLKIHPGILRGPFDALAATAAKLGIGMAGHVPVDVGVERAIEVKYRSIRSSRRLRRGIAQDWRAGRSEAAGVLRPRLHRPSRRVEAAGAGREDQGRGRLERADAEPRARVHGRRIDPGAGGPSGDALSAEEPRGPVDHLSRELPEGHRGRAAAGAPAVRGRPRPNHQGARRSGHEWRRGFSPRSPSASCSAPTRRR